MIDVGCGSGVLAFVAAKLGAAKVYGVDLSQRAVEAARENARRLGSTTSASSAQGDLLEPVRDVQANVLIGDVSGIPDAIAAESGWFDDVPAGGPTGRRAPVEVPAFDRRHPGARRASVPADGHDPERAGDPRAAHEVFGDHMEPVMEREFPLPDLVAKSKAVAQMMKEGLVSFRQRGSRWLWQLRIWRCDRV